MGSTLIDRLIGKAIDAWHAEADPSTTGRSATYGTPHPDYPDVEIRLADRKVIRDIVLDHQAGRGRGLHGWPHHHRTRRYHGTDRAGAAQSPVGGQAQLSPRQPCTAAR